LAVLERLGKPRLLVVGDVMLDRYIWGDAERISQEAPVLTLSADRREDRLGGAAGVATMLRSLEAETSLAGVLGRDSTADRCLELLDSVSITKSAAPSPSPSARGCCKESSNRWTASTPS
jgi:D-beta-D-heptose 7-phosphate kinase/D-beta-D-heptose 1-phosphate adenosyltransferase